MTRWQPLTCVTDFKIPRQQALDFCFSEWKQSLIQSDLLYLQQRQIPLISYRLLFAAMKSHWGLGDLNAIQWWHSGAQQKYHSGLPKWKRAFSLVRKWERITGQEVSRADLQGNVISLALTPVPGPEASTVDENTGISLWSTSKSDWQKAAERMPVSHFEPMVQQTGFHHKKAFLLPLHILWHRGHKMPYLTAPVWEEAT